MRRYGQLLAVFLVLLFFSNVDLYLFLAELTTVTPKEWVMLCGVLLFPLAIHRLHGQQSWGTPLGRMALWSFAYLAISVAWYGVAPSEPAVQELWNRLLTVGFLGLAGFVFVTPESRTAAGSAAIVVVLAMVAINLVEMLRPDWFFMQMTTRSSGLYGNANQCGAALVIGMTICSPLVPRRLRLSFYLLVGVGVAITFSRSTIIGWLIASAILLAFDSVRTHARELVIGALSATALSAVLLQGVVASNLTTNFTLDNNLFERVSFFTTFDMSDAAAQERREVASRAWGMFADRPMLGNGLASTMQWDERVGAHNMFLSLMVDHGVLGTLILPALLLCVFVGRPRTAPGPHWAFCAFVVWYAFFSHGILSERYQLLAFAFFAMGGTVGVQEVPGRLLRASRSRGIATTDSVASVVTAQ